MKSSFVRCASSSPSAPARERRQSPENAVTEDAKANFCVLALPLEDEIRDLFEKAMAASTMAELYEAWAEIDRRRSGTWSDLAVTGLRGQ